MRIASNAWNRLRYTLWAPVYDAVVRFGPQRRRSIALLRLEPGDRVLIVGAGTGADLDALPPGVRIVAGDIAPAMVARVRRRAARLGHDVQAEVMDGAALAFPDGSFDAVILHLIVAVIPDPAGCLREAARVLRPGGRAVVFDKFVPDGEEPSLLRRAVNPFARIVATELTRRLGPLLEGTPLRVVHREPAALGGAFEIVLLERAG
jgi:phosphatidylethanolamine/phosphatidyl-N-methylethanolamine N-methyltransferase